MVPHVECYALLRDWLLSGACHGAGYMLVLLVVLVHLRKRLVAKWRLSWRRIYASVACGACSFAVAKTWNSAGSAFRRLLVLRAPCSSFQVII